jgi:hypothetical protein
MTNTGVIEVDAEQDRAGDIDFALYVCGFSAADVADRAVALAVKYLRRDPRFASLTITEIEDVLHYARRDLEEDVAGWIAAWIDDIERAAL